MRKLAVYVEGYTEQEFIARYIREIVGSRNVTTEERLASGSGGGRTLKTLRISKIGADQRFYVLIVNCGSDNSVASAIRESYNGHITEGFVEIIAFRDVFPKFTAAEIPNLRVGLHQGIPNGRITPLFVLGVMEIEAWFLAEYSHFQRLHPALPCATIQANLGFDPSVDDMQLRPGPANDLHMAYALIGQGYSKRTNQRASIVELLDYGIFYLSPPAIPDLVAFNQRIDSFIAV